MGCDKADAEAAFHKALFSPRPWVSTFTRVVRGAPPGDHWEPVVRAGALYFRSRDDHSLTFPMAREFLNPYGVIVAIRKVRDRWVWVAARGNADREPGRWNG